MILRALALSALAAVSLAAPVRAELDAAATAMRAAEMLEQAGFALLEADGARDRVEALTQTVRAYEEGLLALREGIRQAALREQTILLVFEAERDRLSRLLAVLQSIEGAPPPLLLMHPEGPLGTARSGMIVSEVTPAVAAQAQVLRAQLEELATLRAVQDGALDQLSAALDRAQDARTRLSQAIADRRMLPANFTEDRAAMADLIQSVDSLDGLAEILASAPPSAAPDLPDFAESRGTLPPPLLARVLRRFNEADGAGVTRPGLVLASRPRALVSAPWPASVRYAGPLLDYGNVIILEPEGTYLLVLAGLGTLYVQPGDLVTSGAALGLMPGDATPGSEELIVNTAQTGGTELTETLYIEVRDGGQPVDPAEWFALDGPLPGTAE
jgi:septal ring factor EnvC (AmiA/AmiB activator)